MKRFLLITLTLLSLLFSVLLLTGTGQFVYPFLSDAYCLHLFALALMILLSIGLLFEDRRRANYPPLN